VRLARRGRLVIRSTPVGLNGSTGFVG